MIEKRKVTMTSVVAVPKTDENPSGVSKHEAVDHVPVDLLGVYVADARERWQSVTVGDEHDAGPGGDDGLTTYPAHLDHELAGQTFGTAPTTEDEVV